MIGRRKGITRLVLIFGLALSASYSRGAEPADPPTEDRPAERGDISSPNDAPPLPAPFSAGQISSPDPNRKEIAAPTAPLPSPSDQKEAGAFWSVLSHGAILSEIRPAGKIIGSKDSKMMLGVGDTVYLRVDSTLGSRPLDRTFGSQPLDSGEAAPQKEYVVIREIQKVYHPVTGKYLGHLIRVVGMVKTLAPEAKQGAAAVTRSNDVIEKGDLILPMERLSAAERSLAPPPSSRLEGTIVETKENHTNNGQMDIVYIDRGEKDGVTAGVYFEITHQGAQTRFQSDSSALPRRAGKLVVLSAQDQTATAQIVESAEPISKGDPIASLP